ncbi:MAG: DinB family protein [Gemmatimonadaceae bacterium]
MGMTQRELQQSLKSEALANHKRVAELARPLDPERLVRRPTPPGWSVGEVLEHLCVVDELYHTPLTALVATARPDAAAPAREWHPTFFGRLIAGALGRPTKMKAPGKFKPGESPRNRVVEDFLARDSRLIALMDDVASLDWRALRMSSPALPVPIIRLNLGDVFKIHVVHVRRHLGQMERVVSGMKQ